MAKIPEELKDFLKSHLVFVGTVNAKGVPNVVPKGSMAILDDSTIVFADLYSHQTKKNLLENKNIALTVINPAGYSGYQVKGTAKIIEHGKQYDRLTLALGGDAQLGHPNAKYAVKIAVRKIINVGYGDRADKEITH